MTAPYAARTFLALTALAIAFQLALAAGAPWGELTMGGAYAGRIPDRMRWVAVASAAVLAVLGAVVAARAGLALPRWLPAARRLIWAVVAFMCVGVALNAATPSARERAIWLPVTAALAVCAFIVARSATPTAPLAGR